MKTGSFENPYRMTSRGEVIRDNEAYRRELMRSMSATEDSAEWKLYLAEGGDRDIRQYKTAMGFEDFVLPDRRVRPGDEWCVSAILDTPRGRYQKTHTYLLKAVEDGVAAIRMRQSEELVPGADVAGPPSMKVTTTLVREASFSIEKGLLIDLREEKVLSSGDDQWKSRTLKTSRRTLQSADETPNGGKSRKR
jgi:hypothetical protein